MSGRSVLPLLFSMLLLLALAAQAPFPALGLRKPLWRAQRVSRPHRQRSAHHAQHWIPAKPQKMLPNRAAIRAQILPPGKVATVTSVLPSVLGMLPKMSHMLMSPKPTPTLGPEPSENSYLAKKGSQILSTRTTTTQAPSMPPVLSNSSSEFSIPLSVFTVTRTLDMFSSLPISISLAPQVTTASLKPVQISRAPAGSLVPIQPSVLPQMTISSQIPAASLVPAQSLSSISSQMPTQILTSSPMTLNASLEPTPTSQMIQTSAPTLIPIQTSILLLPLAVPKELSPTIPTLPPVLPKDLAVSRVPSQVSKLPWTSAARVVQAATPDLSPSMSQTKAIPLVPSQTLSPTVGYTQIPTPFLRLSRTLPHYEAQAPVPTHTLAPPPGLQKCQILTSTELLAQTIGPPLESREICAPPPEPTVPLAPPPEPPPKPTKLSSPSPELKGPPVSLTSPRSIQTFPSPSHLAHATVSPPSLSQNEAKGMNLHCLGLCTCKTGMLSCTGLSPELRLKTVPIPGPEAHEFIFSSLDFHGNSISALEGSAWKSYPWAETLNLKDNALRKLNKNSFESLLSLQYLDLSSNKISIIESGTFESIPFLQFLNLSCNLLKNLRYGTFQTWHGMQFLQSV